MEKFNHYLTYQHFPALKFCKYTFATTVAVCSITLLLAEIFVTDILISIPVSVRNIDSYTLLSLFLVASGILSTGIQRRVAGAVACMVVVVAIAQFPDNFFAGFDSSLPFFNSERSKHIVDTQNGQMSIFSAANLLIFGFLLSGLERFRKISNIILSHLLVGLVFVMAFVELYGALLVSNMPGNTYVFQLHLNGPVAFGLLLLDISIGLGCFELDNFKRFYQHREDRQILATLIGILLLMLLAAALDNIGRWLADVLGLSENTFALSTLLGSNPYAGISELQFGLMVLTVVGVLILGRISRNIARRLQHLDTLLVNILDVLPVGVLATDAQGEVINANPAFQDICRRIGDCNSDLNVQKDTVEFNLPQALRPKPAICDKETAPHEILDIQCADGSRKKIAHSSLPIRNKSGKTIGAIAVNQDITKEVEATEQLVATKQFFEMAFEKAGLGMLICDIEGRFLKVNEAYAHILGYGKDELVGKHFTDISHTEDLEADIFTAAQWLAGEIPSSPLEKRFIHKNGQIIWVLLSATLVYGIDGQPSHFLGQIVDISERKKTDLELQRWQDVFRLAQWGVVIGNPGNNTLELMNPAYAAMHGYTVEELTGRNIETVYAPQCHAGLQEHFNRAHQQGHYTFESLHRRKDGTVFPVDVDITVVYDEFGKVGYRLVNTVDISQRKRIEQELRDSKNLLHSIIENIPVMLFLKNAGTLQFEMLNRQAEKIIGYTQQEMLGKTDYDFFPKDIADSFSVTDKAALQAKQSVNIAEEQLQTKTGETIILQTRKIGLYNDLGQPTHLLGVSLDITALKQTEASLQDSKDRLSEAERIAHLGSWEWNMLTGELIWSEETYRIFGCAPGKDQPSYDLFISMLPAEDKIIIQQGIDAVKAGETSFNAEYRIVRPDGVVRYLQSQAEVKRDANNAPYSMLGTNLDITERMQVLQNLRVRDVKLQSLFLLSPLGIALTDMQGHFLEFNPAFQKICGYNEQELKAIDYWELTPEKYQSSESQQLNALSKHGRYGPYEKEYKHKNGRLIPLRLNGVLIKGSNGQEYIWSIVEDITEKREAEIRLREISDELRRLLEVQTLILDALPANIVLIDQQGMIQTSNSRWDNFAGKDHQSTENTGIGCNYLEICDGVVGEDGEAAQCVANGIRQILNGDLTQFVHEYICRFPNGELWFRVIAVPLINKDSVGAVIMHMDITESRLAVKQLQDREEEYRALVENSPDVIIRFNRQSRLIYVNPAITSVMGISPEAFIGKPLHELNLPASVQEGFKMAILSVLENKVYTTFEFTLKVLFVDSHFHASFIPEFHNQDDVINVLVLIRNVTESKDLQFELAESRVILREMAAQNEKTREEERKHIAREIHDELGQILTVLRMEISILKLRFRDDNSILLEKFGNMLGLLDSAIMSVRNVATILRPAALDMGLIASLEWLCTEFTKHSNIPVNFHSLADTVVLDENRSVMIFRIAQESLTNITRYAEANQVDMSLERDGNILTIQIRDNGKGFDQNKLSRHKSFGLLGMRERAIVLSGDLNIISFPGMGTLISLSIPIQLSESTNDHSNTDC